MKIRKIPYLTTPLYLSLLGLLATSGPVYSHPESECKTPDSSSATSCPEELGSDVDSDYAETAVANVFFWSNTGYIDSALVRNQFRLRYDWNDDSEFPDRAEFIYGQCDCGPDGISPGPALDFSYEELEVTFEYAFGDRFSVFTEMPYRFVDLDTPEIPGIRPARQLEEDGIGDIRAGMKYALINDPGRYLTLQLKGYFSTGDEGENLGTGHDSIEPGLLYLHQLDDNWTLESEARWWHPINGTDYEGDVLRFGLGASYNHFGSTIQVSPVVELVGWYVVDGKKTNADPIRVQDAAGDTITNLKLGVRMRAGNLPGSVYLGYGIALTDEDWYDQVFRVEYRVEAFN